MKIFNSLSKTTQEFSPLKRDRVTMYVCGITPYDTTHLGHAYTYIFFDALQRYLRFKGFEVIYTQNVTDVNDRDKDILERARQRKILAITGPRIGSTSIVFIKLPSPFGSFLLKYPSGATVGQRPFLNA